MSYEFRKEEIEKINNILGITAQAYDSSWSWNLHNKETHQSVVFTIYNKVNIGLDKQGALVSVQTQHGYFELHDCNGFMVFEPDEIIFVHSTPDTVSCLTIGKQATCSLYSNIQRNILKTDPTTLDAPILLSAMQLSIAEEVL